MAKIPAKSSKTFELNLDPSFLKENKFLIGGVIVGLILLIIGIVQLVTPQTSSSQIEIVPETSSVEGEIVVDVAGAVEKPGIYKLGGGARVANALEAAGNFSQKADFSWVSKNLNLAAKLQDGAKIYIPQKGEASSSTLGVATNTAISGKINLNTANQAQLESLPAVGPVTAGKIIAGRPYNSVEELLTKKVVGKSTFNKIKDLISVF